MANDEASNACNLAGFSVWDDGNGVLTEADGDGKVDDAGRGSDAIRRSKAEAGSDRIEDGEETEALERVE